MNKTNDKLKGTVQRRKRSCVACRQVKARCEVLTVLDLSCHRCKTLKTPCSLDQSYFVTPRLLEVDVPLTLTITPNQSARAWSFLPWHFDWSAPLAIFRQLLNPPEAFSIVEELSYGPETLQQILHPSEIDELLLIFYTKYAPWLNFALRSGTFLDLACCTITCRHLTPARARIVSPRLVHLIGKYISNVVLNPGHYQSLETVQGLAILSMWSPISEGRVGDGRALASVAITIGMNLRYHKASSRIKAREPSIVPSLRPPEPSTHVDDDTELLEQAQLWLALINIESMLCLGSGRPPLSRRSNNDVKTLTHITGADGRHLPMRIMTEILASAELGLAIELANVSDLETWFSATSSCLAAFDGISKVITPFSVASEQDKLWYHLFSCTLLSCRLLVIDHVVRIARAASPDHDSPVWFKDIKPRGLDVIRIWGSDANRSAEALLTNLLQSDSSSLVAGPDVMFTWIAFAAGVIVEFNVYMMDYLGITVSGWAQQLLEKTVNLLSEKDFPDPHAARRCACVVEHMLRAWMARKEDTRSIRETSAVMT
ncbi:hypothetical protein BDZ89DRAFT_1064553 [Hymenopellis radicata]|nr:hypothetical protein BDZ89DRAFT_1064553 [Hymenopellis radicata]